MLNYDLILNNEFEIIITTPAYSLWPYQNIGCILMIDQESSNYRNDQSPRYDLNLVMDFLRLRPGADVVISESDSIMAQDSLKLQSFYLQKKTEV